MEEFERLEAEGQLLQGLGEGGCGSIPAIPLVEPACRQDIYMQRPSECGEGSEGSLVSTTSLVWWYQPVVPAPKYWSFWCSTVLDVKLKFELESDQFTS